MIGRAYESHLQVLRHVYKHITIGRVIYKYPRHVYKHSLVVTYTGICYYTGGGVLQNITASFHLQINLKAAITAAFSYKTNLINSQLS